MSDGTTANASIDFLSLFICSDIVDAPYLQTHTHKHGSAPTDLEASMARYGEILHLVLSSCYPCSLRRVDLKLGQ